MYTSLFAARSLDKATGTTIWVGLVFTVALLVAMALIAWATKRWYRNEPAEHEAAAPRGRIPKAA